MTWNGDPIVTRYVYPPIPVRSFDWAAYLDGQCGCPECHAPCGHGATEGEALQGLLEELYERQLEIS